MGFFDLNIPYLESPKPVSDNSTKKTTRLKLTVKAIELGYTGIAYNRSIKGVMSESDRCTISLFPLSSILKLSPTISSAANFHRNILGVPISTPFRQYTRLTVVVDSSSQASALNSGNPILKTYDIVAVKPVNQNAFEQACKASEVDLIAIDFSEKLPFRLKQPLIKAAIERGVYFEITYASLLMDAQPRSQMITNAKLLVDWTRGKNLIFTSAAPSITELRGPYDVANLSTLLGLSMERAKAAISKNCRSLIANALRKKQFYKEAIRVEVISSSEKCDSKEPGFDDWLKWDPISSGEGDLLLDEMAKSFRASNKASNNVKAIDFRSVVDSLPAHGLQIKDLIPVTKPVSEPPNNVTNLSSAQEALVPTAVNGASVKVDVLNLLPEECHTLFDNTPVEDRTSSCADKGRHLAVLPADTLKGTTKDEEIVTLTMSTEKETMVSNGVDDLHLQSHTSICETQVMLTADTLKGFSNAEEMSFQANIPEEDPKSANRLDVCMGNREAEVDNLRKQSHIVIHETHATSPDVVMDEISIAPIIKINAVAAVEANTVSKDHISASPNEEHKRSNNDVLATPDVLMDEVSVETDIKSKSKLSFASCDLTLDEGFTKRELSRESGCDAVLLSDRSPILEYNNMLVNNDSSLANHEPMTDVTIEEQRQTENQSGMISSTSGRGRVKQRTSHHAHLFPFKRLWNPTPFKKKTKKSKQKIIAREVFPESYQSLTLFGFRPEL